jgi:triosephosphate isomerase
MKKIWLGSSWKMNKTSAEAEEFCQLIDKELVDLPDSLQTFFIPPFPYVQRVADSVTKHGTRVGVQNICWADAGAFTGEVSASMAADIGATLVEIGHSERRAMFNETDEAVNKKVLSSLKHGLTPLVCVGDTLDEKQWNVSNESIVRQVKIALFNVAEKDIPNVIIAYEPVWAIGENGIPATAQEAEEGLFAIKSALIEMYGKAVADKMVLLYGGSVHPDNAQALIQQPSIDGLFVGRSAWQAEGFAKLISLVKPFCENREEK